MGSQYGWLIIFSFAATLACNISATAVATEPPSLQASPLPVEFPSPTVLPPPEYSSEPTEEKMPFELTSPIFKQGEQIPVKYSCKGEDISPPLAWSDPPGGTQSFALIMDDPDAPGGTWIHWIVFNIPADIRALPENMPAGMKFDDVAASFGTNSWGRAEYGGPCPPFGTHRYFFKLYALDTTLTLEPESQNNVFDSLESHTLAKTELMGTFKK